VAVEKGRHWGAPATPPDGIQRARTDAAAGEIVATAMRDDVAPPAILLEGGDLRTSLGGSDTSGSATVRFMIDVVEARTDSGKEWFVAHLVARHSWWWGRVVAAMNADFLGAWQPAPQAHPGDGFVEIVDADLALRQRFQARRRLPAGDHIPHPHIDVRRVREIQLRFAAATPVWIDGRRRAKTRELALRVLPDVLTVYI
jgi:hypothetical protein